MEINSYCSVARGSKCIPVEHELHPQPDAIFQLIRIKSPSSRGGINPINVFAILRQQNDAVQARYDVHDKWNTVANDSEDFDYNWKQVVSLLRSDADYHFILVYYGFSE